MNKILLKKSLNPTVTLMEVDAPLVARKAEPGQFIISGAMGGMLPADPGNYVADFGSFGKIEFVVKNPQ